MSGLGIKWFRATFYRIVNSAGYGVISDNPNITNPRLAMLEDVRMLDVGHVTE